MVIPPALVAIAGILLTSIASRGQIHRRHLADARIPRMLGDLTVEIGSDEVLEVADAWLGKRREHYSRNVNVWEVRFRWNSI